MATGPTPTAGPRAGSRRGLNQRHRLAPHCLFPEAAPLGQCQAVVLSSQCLCAPSGRTAGGPVPGPGTRKQEGGNPACLPACLPRGRAARSLPASDLHAGIPQSIVLPAPKTQGPPSRECRGNPAPCPLWTHRQVPGSPAQQSCRIMTDNKVTKGPLPRGGRGGDRLSPAQWFWLLVLCLRRCPSHSSPWVSPNPNPHGFRHHCSTRLPPGLAPGLGPYTLQGGAPKPFG